MTELKPENKQPSGSKSPKNSLARPSVKSKVEAILFSTGHRISVEEISRLSRSLKDDVLGSLKELQREYDEKQSSLMLADEGDFWKFTVRDHFIPIVRKIVTETELTKSVLETLAVIAFKYPILQSDLIKIRTNKAYDHLVELEKSGYISRQKHGRTNLIKLTDKFFRYFDLTEEKLKDQFRDFDSIAKAIKDKEVEVEQIKEEQRRKAEDLKKEDEKIKKEIESLDKSEEDFEIPLETYESKPKGSISKEFEQEGNLVVEKEKLGDIEIIDEEQSKEPHQSKPQVEEHAKKKSTIFESGKEMEKPKRQKKKREGISLTPEMEKEVDEKVQEMMGLSDEKKEKNQD